MCLSIFDLYDLEDSSIVVTSEATIKYNCFAWSVDEGDRWWEPTDMGGYYWPPGIPKTYRLEAIIQLYQGMGYVEIDEPDGRWREYEVGCEKVAIYADNNSIVRHVARQISDEHVSRLRWERNWVGQWTSKLKEHEDIRHGLEALEGRHFGYVVVVMRRNSQP
jgi:hypothetical protein